MTERDDYITAGQVYQELHIPQADLDKWETDQEITPVDFEGVKLYGRNRLVYLNRLHATLDEAEFAQ